MVGVASAEAKAPCEMPLFIQAVHGTPDNSADSTGNLFLYGLKSAVKQHQGCIVDRIADAQLSLYITSVRLAGNPGATDSSVISVALAVPLHGIPVYMDDYVMVVRAAESIDGPVNELLQNIGETLDRHSSQN